MLCGLALGLAALTRSVLWPLPVVLCPLLAVLIQAPLARRLALPALVLVGYVVVVAPWAVRNTRLQEVLTVVDTMGGINLRMGNYGYTPDDRMWDAVSIGGEKSWVRGFATDRPDQKPTEGRKDKWAQRKALAYMRAHPMITARRSLIKFADFWGLDREFIAGVQTGLFSPPTWLAAPAALAIVRRVRPRASARELPASGSRRLATGASTCCCSCRSSSPLRRTRLSSATPAITCR